MLDEVNAIAEGVRNCHPMKRGWKVVDGVECATQEKYGKNHKISSTWRRNVRDEIRLLKIRKADFTYFKLGRYFFIMIS